MQSAGMVWLQAKDLLIKRLRLDEPSRLVALTPEVEHLRNGEPWHFVATQYLIPVLAQFGIAAGDSLRFAATAIVPCG
jgi:hypothetical protein